MRLYHSFKDSLWPIKQRLIYCHILNMFLMEISWIIQSILDYLEIHPWNQIAAVLGVIIFMIGYCHILYKFNYNLFQLMMQQRASTTSVVTFAYQPNVNNFELNSRQKEMLQAAVKQTVLACWLCFILSLYAVSFVVTSVIDPKQKSNELLIFDRWMIALMINGVAITLLLTFEFYSGCYERICSKCHNKCDQICENKATKSIMRHSSNYRMMDI